MNLTRIEKGTLAVLLGVALAAAVAAALLGLCGCRMNGCILVDDWATAVFLGNLGDATQAADKELLRGAKAEVKPGGL